MDEGTLSFNDLIRSTEEEQQNQESERLLEFLSYIEKCKAYNDSSSWFDIFWETIHSKNLGHIKLMESIVRGLL